MNVTEITSFQFLDSKLTENKGEIFIASKKYSYQQDIATIRKAVKKLPAPFTTIQQDYNKSLYTVKKDEFTIDFRISVTNKDPDTNLLTNNQIKSCGDHIFKIKVNRRNDGTNEDTLAYNVHQGQVRYTKSGSYKLGTTNVQDCVATIIQDKKTTQLALAHVSTHTHHIIDSALKYLPQGEKNVILIGARYPDNTYNVDGILEKLMDYSEKVYLDTSYIFDNQYMITEYEDIISCYETNTNFGTVTVNPKTLEITNKYPITN